MSRSLRGDVTSLIRACSACSLARCFSANVDKNDYNNWSNNIDEKPHRMSCRYSELNDPFCCVRRSRNPKFLSMGRTTPKKLSIPVDDLLHPHGSLGPHGSAPKTASRSVQPFCRALSLSNVTTHTDRQTDRTTTLLCVCSNGPRCGLIITRSAGTD